MQLILHNVRKSFDKKEVLRGVTYSFTPGKIYGLLGRNGAGKTTLFSCISNDLDKDGGSIILNDGYERELTQEEVGFVLSTPVVPAFLTGREFLKFYMDINIDNIWDPRPVDVYFDMVGIAPEDRDRLMNDYSHGMKTKMQMIVNIIAGVNVLLLDEPLTSLDVVAASEMKNLLRAQKNDKIMLVSTHIMELAVTLCDEILILKNGYVRKMENTDEYGNPLSQEEFSKRIVSILSEGE